MGDRSCRRTTYLPLGGLHENHIRIFFQAGAAACPDAGSTVVPESFDVYGRYGPRWDQRAAEIRRPPLRNLALSRYTRGPKTLHISGDIHLAFEALTDHFFVRLHFIDDNQKIIGTEVIATAGYRTRVETYHFDKTMEVPSGTIAFSYDGEIRGVSDDGSWSFWLDPRKGGGLGQLFQ